MWRRSGYQEEHHVHEESWQSENEYYSYGSGMQMMPRPYSPPKPSKHQMMINGANNMHHDGRHKQEMVQDGWNGSGAHLFNRHNKPHYGMNESQFSRANMHGGYGKHGNNAYHQMHGPAESVIVEEEVMYEENSSWQTNDAHYNDNFKNWMHNGYNNPHYCMPKAV